MARGPFPLTLRRALLPPSLPPSIHPALLPTLAALAFELLSWFKQDFFRWVSAPPCAACGAANTHSTGAVAPTAEEAAHKAGRTELFRCGQVHKPSLQGVVVGVLGLCTLAWQAGWQAGRAQHASSCRFPCRQRTGRRSPAHQPLPPDLCGPAGPPHRAVRRRHSIPAVQRPSEAAGDPAGTVRR